MKYSLLLALTDMQEYQGIVEIKFVLGEQNDGIFLDYSGTEVGDICINEKIIPAKELFYKHRIRIPSSVQKVGENIVNFDIKDLI